MCVCMCDMCNCAAVCLENWHAELSNSCEKNGGGGGGAVEGV